MAELKYPTSGPDFQRSSIDVPSIKTEKNMSVAPQGITRSILSRTTTERVRELLISLSTCDSLYLCPTNHQLPDAVAAKLQRAPVRKYEIKDYFGVTRYYAAELSSKCQYHFCSNDRAFQIFMYGPNGDIIFESVRPCTTQLCICGVDCCCCVVGIETDANFRSGGNYIGSVVTGGSCLTPTFIVQNVDFDEKFTILGPQCSLLLPCRLFCIDNFAICVPSTEVSVGKIMYGYDGLTEDLVPNPKTVGVIFPPRCSPESKALLIAAGFMLDVTYFEKRGCTLHRVLRQFVHLSITFGICALVIYLIFEFEFDNS